MNALADFAYDVASDPAGLPARVAIYGACKGVRDEIASDLAGAGFRTHDGGTLACLNAGEAGAPLALLGDVVVVVCPVLDAAGMAGLARLDERAARSSAKLVVVTSLDALDAVFALLDQSHPQIMIAPSRAERVLAVGRACGEAGAARLREMSDEERVSLLQLSSQVDAIARSLDRMSAHNQAEWGAPGTAAAGLRDAGSEFRGADHRAGTAGALPDPKLVRRIIANRQKRIRFFDANLFADPAWDMLLDLTAARCEGHQVSVTSLCIAAGVPATTALRWITQMVDTGVFQRVADPADKRRAFIALSENAAAGMAGYFACVEEPLVLAV